MSLHIKQFCLNPCLPFRHFSSVSDGTSAPALTTADEDMLVVAADEHDDPLPKEGFLGSG